MHGSSDQQVLTVDQILSNRFKNFVRLAQKFSLSRTPVTLKVYHDNSEPSWFTNVGMHCSLKILFMQSVKQHLFPCVTKSHLKVVSGRST